MKACVCVVGAGLAGGTIAAELARDGYQVRLVEVGQKVKPLVPGDEIWSELVPNAIFTRGMGLGGTSNFWHGGLTPLDSNDVDGEELGKGRPRSPIRYAEFVRYYERAVGVMGGGAAFGMSDILAAPDPSGNEFEIASDRFAYKGLLYPTSAFCSTGLIAEATRRYGLKVVKGFDVKRVVFSGSSRAVGIEGVDGQAGGICRIEADVIVLSAGGIGSPRILLNSVSESERLRALPVGRYLIDHPTGFVFKAKLRKRLNLEQLFAGKGNGFRMQYGFVLRPDSLHLAGGRNHVVYLRPAVSMKDPAEYDFLKKRLVAYKGRMLSPLDVGYLLRHSDLLFDALNFKLGLFHSTRYVSGLTFAEQFPSDGWEISKMTDGRYAVNWGVSRDDERSLAAFVDAFAGAHEHVFESVECYSNLSRRLDTACHHSGGCRMGWGPEDGVVDASLRVFGTDNLFVSDGSAIRYAGCANTGLTIGALALKCCDSIRQAFS